MPLWSASYSLWSTKNNESFFGKFLSAFECVRRLPDLETECKRKDEPRALRNGFKGDGFVDDIDSGWRAMVDNSSGNVWTTMSAGSVAVVDMKLVANAITSFPLSSIITFKKSLLTAR